MVESVHRAAYLIVKNVMITESDQLERDRQFIVD
jgi:hypothetical protein